ncbi:MAG: hypothetical protein ACE5DY_06330 [Mariprofundaceae bacterium]
MDLFSLRIVDLNIDTSRTRKLVSDALLMAMWCRKLGKGLIRHSDHGSLYCSGNSRNCYLSIASLAVILRLMERHQC